MVTMKLEKAKKHNSTLRTRVNSILSMRLIQYMFRLLIPCEKLKGPPIEKTEENISSFHHLC